MRTITSCCGSSCLASSTSTSSPKPRMEYAEAQQAAIAPDVHVHRRRASCVLAEDDENREVCGCDLTTRGAFSSRESTTPKRNRPGDRIGIPCGRYDLFAQVHDARKTRIMRGQSDNYKNNSENDKSRSKMKTTMSTSSCVGRVSASRSKFSKFSSLLLSASAVSATIVDMDIKPQGATVTTTDSTFALLDRENGAAEGGEGEAEQKEAGNENEYEKQEDPTAAAAAETSATQAAATTGSTSSRTKPSDSASRTASSPGSLMQREETTTTVQKSEQRTTVGQTVSNICLAVSTASNPDVCQQSCLAYYLACFGYEGTDTYKINPPTYEGRCAAILPTCHRAYNKFQYDCDGNVQLAAGTEKLTVNYPGYGDCAAFLATTTTTPRSMIDRHFYHNGTVTAMSCDDLESKVGNGDNMETLLTAGGITASVRYDKKKLMDEVVFGECKATSKETASGKTAEWFGERTDLLTDSDGCTVYCATCGKGVCRKIGCKDDDCSKNVDQICGDTTKCHLCYSNICLDNNPSLSR
ncbi:unnamed protein product [Amoebophrya sp. A120]|nr:unnamed protein product [Amoebophrya sp. A120]|eukprot:GSA120T00022428001.1